MTTSLLTGWFLALMLGVRHASEPDHLVAVSTLLADRSPAAGRSAPLGAWWGLGHALALFALGGGLLSLRLQMPSRVADLLELGVAMMLLVLGGRTILRATRAGSQGHHRPHLQHLPHAHAKFTERVLVSSWTTARGPMLIGLAHGVAGSGAITALALANMPSLGAGLIYIMVFGAGSILGMALLTGLAQLPLSRVARRSNLEAAMGTVAGTMSLVMGLRWGWPVLLRLLAA